METITKELEEKVASQISYAFHDVGVDQSMNCWSNFSLAMFMADELDHLRTDKVFKATNYSVSSIQDYLWKDRLKANPDIFKRTVDFITELEPQQIEMMKNCFELLQRENNPSLGNDLRNDRFDIVTLKYQLEIICENISLLPVRE